MPSPPPAARTPTATTLFSSDSELDVTQAAHALRAGRLVAFPTETVYGLGADATNPSAVLSIFSAKRRPPDNPLIVHLSSLADLSRWPLTPLPLAPPAARLAAAFWPGPLTLVLPLARAAPLAPAVVAGLRSVAVRVPRHPVASALLARAAIPVAAPSANTSGRPSPTSAAHVLRDLDGAVFAVVDGGDLAAEGANCGLESTVVDMTHPDRPAVLRPGALSLRDLERVSGVQFCAPKKVGKADTPKAPGMKYRHYAPNAPLHIVRENAVHGRVEEEIARGGVVGLLADDAVCDKWRGKDRVAVVRCGRKGDVHSFARELYAGLRAFDGEGEDKVEGVNVILAVPPSDVEDGIGAAVINRLTKAAAGKDDNANDTRAPLD